MCLLQTGGICVADVENLLGVYLPVLECSLHQARHHHKQQHQDVDAREHLVHNGGLLHSKRQQTWGNIKTDLRGREGYRDRRERGRERTRGSKGGG